MNGSTDKIVASLIQKAIDGVDQAINFSKAQLPDVVEQLMHWKLVAYSLRVATCILIITGMCFVFKKGYQWNKALETETVGFLCLLLSSLMIISSLSVMIVSIGNLIELWCAPKVWLIEYAGQLMSSK